MREIFEFRVVEEFADRLFRPDEGKKLSSGIIRIIRMSGDDPRLARVGELRNIIREESGRTFFHGWEILRKYTENEIEAAPLLHLKIKSVFQPAGEEHGTEYNESSACLSCGAGAQQIGPLVLDVKRIPKGRDIAKTIAGEIVVSRRLVEAFKRRGISGVSFGPVRMHAASSAESKDWFQLSVVSASAEITMPTRVGIDPFDFDESGKNRCTQGDLLGLNLLSEVTICSSTRGDADVFSSRQFVGVRRGLLRPERMIFISSKVWNLIQSENLKDVKVEIAHLA